MVEAYEIAATFRAHKDGEWTRDTMMEAFADIADKSKFGLT